jgi:hypothetical protein
MPFIEIIPKTVTTRRIITPPQVSVLRENVVKELYETSSPFTHVTGIVKVEQRPPPIAIPEPLEYNHFMHQVRRSRGMEKKRKSICNRCLVPTWACFLLGFFIILLVGALATFMAFSPCKISF